MTLFSYIGLFIAYFVFIILKENIAIGPWLALIPKAPDLTTRILSQLIFLVFLFSLFRGFFHPGLLWSTAEWKLLTLPYHPQSIYALLALERAIISFILIFSVGMIYAAITNSPLNIMTGYMVTLWLTYLLSINLRWRFFQKHMIKKILIYIGLVFLSLSINFIDAFYVFLFIIVFILILNIISFKNLFLKVDWELVRHTVDFKLWQMPLLNKVTKLSYKKTKSKAAWYQRLLFQRPFKYKQLGLYHRLWLKYFLGEAKHVAQIIFALLGLNIVLGFSTTFIYMVAAFITVFVWVSFSRAMYRERFTYDIVQYLPWQFDSFRKAFQIWIYILTVLIISPIVVRAIFLPTTASILIAITVIITIYMSIHQGLKQLEYKLTKSS